MASIQEDEPQPRHGEKTTSVYAEAHDMLCYASMMYFVAELRAKARDGTLHNCDAILSLPLTFGEVANVYEQHSQLLKELHGEIRHNRHGRVLETMMSKKSIHPEQLNATTFVVFEDDHPDELVYSIAVDYSTNNVVVAFRGTVTRTDLITDIKAFHKSLPNPLRTKSPNPRNVEIDNPHDADVLNPVSAQNIDKAQKKFIKLHNGIHEYLFRQKTPEDKSKFEVILEQTSRILHEHNGFRLYVTGHSLGGALCTLFSFYAALDPVIVQTATCYSFASPKLGTLSFRKAFQALEAEGKLRHLRVANKDDPVTVMPRDACTILPSDLCCALQFVCLTQGGIYRHVGMGLVQCSDGTHQIFHARRNSNYFRTLMSDWAKLCARFFYLHVKIFQCFLGQGENYRAYHGYPAYFSRLEDNKNELERFHLEELYSFFESGDKEVVKTRYW